jgi:6-pyruvoyltetrahydropterin/6-carboxytetrahydropterin synthase
MTESYRVELSKPQLVFSAAHFITFNGNVCERLHGHNYRVRASIDGPLDENHYVIDFIALRDEMQTIVDTLDHHVLLPTDHPQIKVVADEKEVLATFEDRRWIFPLDDCVLLPVPNTTAELVARYIGLKLLDQLEQRLGDRPTNLTVGVDENGGQWGVWEYSLP